MIEGVTPVPPEFARRYRERGYWDDRPLRTLFAEVFTRFGPRVAIIDGAEHVSYAQLDERSTRLARHLLDLGLRPRDRIVVQLPNTALFAYLYFALQKIGAIPVLALPSHRFREVRQFVEIADAVGCATPLAHKEFSFPDMVDRIAADRPGLRLKLVRRGGGDLPDGFVALEDLLDREPWTGPAALDDIHIDPDDPALFLLSGGTTGIPKLIPRTHNDYAYNSRLAVSVCDVRPDDVLLLVLPIEHNLPLGCPGMQGFLMSGAAVVLSTSTAPVDVFRAVERHRVTHIHLVPSLLIRWLNDPRITDHDLSSLRVLQSGGQRLQPETRDRAERLLPGATVQENFGMAEGLLMFVRLDDDEDVRRETCGRPICPDDEVRLVDDEGDDVAPGEVGELCVRGPYTLRGYFRAPEHNARAFTPDGFYRSGDLLRLHPSGNYVVEGRKKDLVNRGGEKISAEEVENLVLAHPAVVNVGCVPVPDRDLGERMCACVVLREGATLTLDELVEFLLDFEIAKHKLPERLEVFDSLPLSPIGKVSKKDLVARLSEGVRA
ncbi:2,3-dihydroxybenzoate-AMP ligase/mycobactin salicyl-AMP ligase [Amycolatopsis arida]|uniref:2,3-dihydroxybenzoate-AMP ligase/mycobactin salicyl-AMP ligase n=1 Tax=Amycolatopsis arida TaxID=587909 RepID=A0A1I5SQH2_9PSEU|nr:AMP-binding protein [Amycolatopsis arida]TDX96388.1 2,3-dihydroxybenzoate-AMP ligase/mycobactin salicyl-AMP ligase [Amycolatopsis arida]SFP72965.1 2,3-dihydroxybenzoate-AMP ligase/mycobactin salicyl-AMP ligase [Amycolatopsis arida]